MIIEKEIESVLRESHTEHFDWLEKKLDIPLRKGLEIWKDFIEVTERRNLFVHTDGVVSSQYLSVCKKNNVELNSNIKSGDILSVDARYFKTALNCLYEIGIKLGIVIWRKLAPKENEEIDSLYHDLAFDFIVKKNYDVAINLLEFGVNVIKKTTNDQKKYLFIINLAQAYKWKGESAKCISLLDSYDWSPFSYAFRLSNAVLHDNFTEAALYMKRIGAEGEVPKSAYMEWPIFMKFRQNEDFKNAYEEVFKETYEFHGESEHKQNLISE